MPSSLQIQRINPSKPASVVTAGAAVGYHKQAEAGAEVLSVPEAVARYHVHEVGPNQCCSAVVQIIGAPVPIVWSVVRRFDNPQAYKHFLKSCHVIDGRDQIQVGALREVRVMSGLPAAYSTERLEILDDERHVISFSIVGGEHRLENYCSVTTLHQCPAGTAVVESYVVDIPPGNTKEDTCGFINTIVRCNLQSLARISEKLAKATCQISPSPV